jgi:raffinose/stachyose/melibiose transport system permease protein
LGSQQNTAEDPADVRGLARWTSGRSPFRRTPGGASRASRPRRGDSVGYLYILPGLLFFAVFMAIPLVHALVVSFEEWDGLTQPSWAGLANYVDIAADPRLRNAFVHSFYMIFFISILPITIGLFLAAVMARVRIRGLTAFRAILFFPQLIASVVVGITWRWIYSPEGILNRGLEVIGLGSSARAWLGDFTLALPAVGLIGTWVMFGLTMVMFLAGVQKIPSSLYDAARVDGAGPIREFFAVTLPGLRREIVVVAAITVIVALRVFDIVYVTTKGGPGSQTTVPAYEIYQRAFFTGRVGSAAAIGIVVAIFSLLMTLLIIKFGERTGR